MSDLRTHVIYFHNFWHKWMLAQEASRPRIYLPPINPCPGCGNPGGRMCRVPGTHCGY